MEITVQGIKTNYIKEGSGENIIFLHGWGSNLEVFRRSISFLSQTHTVYALDLPGCGGTDEPKIPLDAAGYASFVNDFANRLGVKKASLIGHSNGGRTIIRLATWEGRTLDIDKIILIDSAGIKASPTFAKTLKSSVFKIGKSVLNVGILKKMFPDALKNLQNKFGSEDYRNASPMMKQCMVKLINEDLTPLLACIKFPTLLVWGDKDTATPLSDGKLMEKLIPDSGLVVLKNSGHYSFLEQPLIFTSVLDSFLNTGSK